MNFFQPEQDEYIYKIYKDQKGININWNTIAQHLNQKYRTTRFTPTNAQNRLTKISTKLTKEEIEQVFRAFHLYGLDYRMISQQTSISFHQAKRQIISTVAKNIWTLCTIVRNEQLSKLSQNYLGQDNVKIFVVEYMKIQQFQHFQKQFPLFHNYITKLYASQEEMAFLEREALERIYHELLLLCQGMIKKLKWANIPKENNSYEEILLCKPVGFVRADKGKRKPKAKPVPIDLNSDSEAYVKVEQMPPSIKINDNFSIRKDPEREVKEDMTKPFVGELQFIKEESILTICQKQILKCQNIIKALESTNNTIFRGSIVAQALRMSLFQQYLKRHLQAEDQIEFS